jgi:hypothetical protein
MEFDLTKNPLKKIKPTIPTGSKLAGPRPGLASSARLKQGRGRDRTRC